MNHTFHMVFVAIVFFTLTGSFHYYLWIRLVRDTGLPSPWREIASATLVLLALSIPLTFFLSHAIRFEIFRSVSLAPYTWIGAMMLLIFAFLSVDLIRAILFIAKKIGAPEVLPTDPARRIALSRIIAGVVLLTVSGLTMAAVARAARIPTVKQVKISLPRFPKAKSGLKIVQISDLHVGATANADSLSKLVNQINALKPDIVAITGDLVDGETSFLEPEISSLKHLDAPLGTYFVTGNHEYYSGAGRWIAAIKKLGIHVLRNEALPIGDKNNAFYLAGVDDYASKGMLPGHGQDIPKALSNVPKDKAVVLLAHQPKAVQEASDHSVDLVLSGHTHGGQIWPFSYFVFLQQPYNKGLFRHSDTTQIYVNQGTFTWGPPMRLGTESEITEIVLSGDA